MKSILHQEYHLKMNSGNFAVTFNDFLSVRNDFLSVGSPNLERDAENFICQTISDMN